jgi:hypothetical protein
MPYRMVAPANAAGVKPNLPVQFIFGFFFGTTIYARLADLAPESR